MKRTILLLLCATVAHAATWENTQWNSGVKVKQAAHGFKCVIPQGDSHLNSVQRKQGSIPFRATVVFTCRVTGKAKIVSLDTSPAPPALMPNCRVLIQCSGDDWMCGGDTQHYRWWSTGALCVFLKSDGKTYTYSVKLIPANWTNCWGKSATQYKTQFKDALAHVNNVQIVFGGGNSFSHGVRAKGAATYELLSFDIK